MKDKFVSIFMAFFLVMLATTLVLPGRSTPQAINMFFKALSSSVRAVMGTETENKIRTGAASVGNLVR